MATKFAETPDATQDNKFWSIQEGTVVYDSTTPTKSGVASWKCGDVAIDDTHGLRETGILGVTGRAGGYLRINDYPTSASAQVLSTANVDNSSDVWQLRIKSAGVLFLRNDTGTQIGSDGAVLSTGIWYRIYVCWNITSTTVYTIKLFVDGVQSISASNSPTLDSAAPDLINYRYQSPGANKFLNWQHIYIDDSGALTDPGDIRVSAKRPNANGTTNGFTTQIGVGGSGYGSGHAPQVNERPLSETNGWSMIGAGSAVTEEYNIEGVSIGDVAFSPVSLIDYVGWAYAKSLASETGQIIVNNATSNIALTSTNTMFTKIAGSTTYPAGTGTDIGIITSTDLTTVSLYECGIVMAYFAVPGIASITNQQMESGGFVGRKWV